MNLELIAYLKKQGDFTAMADVEKALKLKRDKLFAAVEDLIEEGYNVEFHPYLGVKLIDIPDRLLEHEIREDLNAERIGKVLRIYDKVESTNQTAWALIEQDPKIADGTVILAESQTSGRGRMGSEWHSPAGCGIWMSVVLKVHLPPEKIALLTATASLAIANMLQQFIQLPSEIKWPNDVMVRGRKVAGVLVEARSSLPETYVMGLGLNVNQQAADFPDELRGIATSLRIERPGQQSINRVRVIRPLLFYLDSVYRLIHKKKFDKVAKAWSEFVPMGGKNVKLRQGEVEFSGTVVEVDPARGITLRLPGAKETRLFAAESVQNVREA